MKRETFPSLSWVSDKSFFINSHPKFIEFLGTFYEVRSTLLVALVLSTMSTMSSTMSSASPLKLEIHVS